MRITGGTLRSRRLLSVKSDSVRPATDRLRETMFDILANMIDLNDSSALDLYAGTGSVGFETISRGAGRVVFVESSRSTADVIRRNAVSLGIEEKCVIKVMRAETFVRESEEKFDVAYVDPPYRMNNSTGSLILEMISRKIVKSDGLICVEHSKTYSPPSSILVRQKIFGSTILSFLTPEEK